MLARLEVLELANHDVTLGVLREPSRAQPRLACTRRTEQRHERVRAIEQLREPREVFVSADEGVGLFEPEPDLGVGREDVVLGGDDCNLGLGVVHNASLS